MRPFPRFLLVLLSPALVASCGGGDGGPAPADAAGGGDGDVPVDAGGDGGEPDATAGDAKGGSDAGDGDGDAADAAHPPVDPAFEGAGVDEVVHLDGLSAPVSVVRDDMGVPHVYAKTLEDAAFAQGYVHALDRMPVMELFRRSAMGTVAELLGTLAPIAIYNDIRTRFFGFPRVAALQAASMEPGSRAERVLTAYSAGVTAYIEELRSGKRQMKTPYHIFIPVAAMEDWSPVHTFAIGRVQAHELAFDGDRELGHTAVMQAISAAFPHDDADPKKALRYHMLGDVFRYGPVDPTFQHDEFTFEGNLFSKVAADLSGAGARRPWVPADLLARGLAFGGGGLLKGDAAAKGASNNWAVGPSRTATGHAMFCNDPHLGLGNPPLFHLSHLVASEGDEGEAVELSGANFAGVPGVLIGHNRHTAWGLTTATDDRSDVYLETFDAGGEGAPPSTLADGVPAPVTVLTDTVKVGSLGEIVEERGFEILITAQGRVLVPDVTTDGTITPLASGEQLSWAWTGFEPTGEFRTLMANMTAETVEDLAVSFEDFHAANQNAVGADDQGHVFAFTPGHIPIREPGAFTWDAAENPEGTAPWWVLPGDGAADWDGYLPVTAGPKSIDPAKGFVVTANNDHVGQTADNDAFDDPFYIGYDYDIGFRAGRVHRLLDGSGAGSPAAGGALLDLEDMRRIQADTRSNPAERLRPLVAPYLEKMRDELAAPGTWPELSALATEHAALAAEYGAALDLVLAWDLETPPGTDDVGFARDAPPSAAEKESAAATTMWNVFLVRLLDLVFGDEHAAMGLPVKEEHQIRGLFLFLGDGPGEMATLDPETGESALWDRLDTPEHVETPGEIVAQAFLEALGSSASLFPEGTPLGERAWGRLHRIVLESLIPIPGGALDLPSKVEDPEGLGFARPGDGWAVNVANGGLTNLDFSYGSGAIIRYCIDLAPGAPDARMQLPGGLVMDPLGPHYKDWLPKWLAHESTPLAFETADVAARAEHHLVLAPPPASP